MRRIVLSLLLAWAALAPGLANACAVQCEMHSETTHQQQKEGADGMDCHGSGDTRDEGSGPSDTLNAAMAASCLLAATASMPSSIVVLASADLICESPTSPFLFPSSLSSAPPDEPPRA